MRNEWYGDKKEVVKWASLLYLAQREGIEHIFYIVMRTDTQQDYPKIKDLNGNAVLGQRDVVEQVANFFDRHKDLIRIEELGKKHNIHIEVWLKRFEHVNRASYFAEVCRKMRVSEPRSVWFFDPDTGIEPNRADGTHIKKQELRDAFAALKSGDFLACYQHNTRRGDWRGCAHKKLARALCKKVSEVKMFKSGYSTEAIILAVRKT